MKTKVFEIMFDDLNPDTQKSLLWTFGTTKEEENWDIVPVCIIEREIKEED